MHITLKLGCSRLDHWVSAALGHQGPAVVCTVPPQRFWLSRARGAHGSLCPMDVSQPEGASVKRTQTAPSTSDPLCLQTPQLLQSCTVPRPDQTALLPPCQLQDVEPSLSGAPAVRKETLAGITISIQRGIWISKEKAKLWRLSLLPSVRELLPSRLDLSGKHVGKAVGRIRKNTHS